MANYALLKAAISAAIKQNGRQEITGDVLQSTLLSIVNSMGSGATFMGVAQLNTSPNSPDGNVFYIAATEGTYPNFSGQSLAAGEVAIFSTTSTETWAKQTVGTVSKKYVDDLGALLDGANQLAARYTVEEDITSTAARLKVPQSRRRRGFVLARVSNGASVEERFIAPYNTATSTDADWTNDSNWAKTVEAKDILDVGRYHLSGGTYAKPDARVIIPQASRSRNFQLSYTLSDGTSLTENFTGADFSDAEWIKDSNWSRLATTGYVDDQVTGVYDDVADFNASLGAFPTTGSGSTGYVMRADCYPVTVAGTVGGLTMKVGDILKAKVDNPAQIASNWIVMRDGVAYTPEDVTKKNIANGYAGLDAAKKLANDIIRTDFRMSQGYIFDGVDDYLTVQHNDKLNFGTDDFSIQCCFTSSPSSRDERIFAKHNKGSAAAGISLRKDANNNLLTLRLFDVVNKITIPLQKHITAKENISFFCTRTDNLIKVYVNGVIDTIYQLPSAGSVNSTEPLTLGAMSDDYLSGYLSLFRLFNRALSQQDITYYENNGRPDLQRLRYQDVITDYGELMQFGDNETALKGSGNFEASTGLVGTYTSNDVSPINGLYDARLQVTGAGNNYARPAIGLPIVNKVGKAYLLSFKSKVNSGTATIYGITKGIGSAIALNKTLITGINKIIFDGSMPSNLASLYLYFDGTKLFDVQLDDYSVRQLGCVLELLPENALPDRWLESQNGLDAITSGSPAINTETPVTDYSIVDNVTNNIAVGTANRDYTLPAGYIVDSVCVNSTVALTALQLVNITTTETLLTGKTVSATANKHLPITTDQSSSVTDTTLRLNATGNGGSGFNIVINIKKCL